MSEPSVPPMGLSSVKGTLIPGMVIDQSPRSGRGKKLTLAQENTLKRIYELELPSLPEGEQPAKGFWVHVATRFRHCTGREYSWLSARRKIMGPIHESQRPKQPKKVTRSGNPNSPPPEIDPGLSNLASDPPCHDTPRQNLHSPQNCEQTPLESPGSGSPESSRLEQSPAVGGELTRRAFFPSAAKRTKQTKTMSNHPGELSFQSQSQKPDALFTSRRQLSTSSRRREVTSGQLDHRLISASKQGGSPDPTTSMSPPPLLSQASGDGDKGKTRSKKRKHPAVDPTSDCLDEITPRGKPESSRQQQKSARKYLGVSSDTSDSDDLPETPCLLSSRDRVGKTSRGPEQSPSKSRNVPFRKP